MPGLTYTGEDRTFELYPSGVYIAECIDIKPEQNTYDPEHPRWQWRAVWEFVDNTGKRAQHNGKKISVWWTQSLNSKSNLMKALPALLGVEKIEPGFTLELDQEPPQGIPTQLLHVRAQLVIGQKPKQDGSMKNVVESFLAIEDDEDEAAFAKPPPRAGRAANTAVNWEAIDPPPNRGQQ